MPVRFTAALLLAASLAYASASPAGHPHIDTEPLPGKWYHGEDHPVYNLFRRAGNGDGIAYPAIGTPGWSAGFPAASASTTNMPQAWTDALHKAVAAGKIPNIPLSTVVGQQNPAYPPGHDPSSPTICSSTYKCVAAGDIWNAPPGVIALSFDDGPLPASTTLYEFLAKNNERVTHFFIGQNMLANPQQLQTAINTNKDDLAVHTWTHPFMTTKSNEEVIAELGWTMQLIHNSTGGRIPRFWRPPYGDSDMRVRAIAKEVFGLTTVVWNHDTNDWTLDQNPPGTSLDKIQANMQTWLSGSKSPGLVILEHELSEMAVQSFINAYPLMVSNGWKRVSLARMDGLGVYLNSLDDTSPVTPAHVADVNIKVPIKANGTTAGSTPTAKSQRPHSAHSPSGSPHANQKSGAEHFSTASVVLSGIAAVIAAVVGSIFI